jgi:hypothetical protein
MRRPSLAAVVAAALVATACSAGPAGALQVQTETRSESLPVARLAGLPQLEVTVQGQTFHGPRLREALLLAGVPAGGDLEVIAADGRKQVVGAATAARDDVVLALDVPAEEGPLRLVVPDSPELSVRRVVAVRAVPVEAPL